MTGSFRSTNMVSISGALIVVFSLLCPWFRLEFSADSRSLAGFQLLSGWISGSRYLATLTGISMLFLVFASGAALLAMAGTRWWLDVALTGSKLLLVVEIALVGAVGIALYLLVAWALRIGEVTEVLTRLTSRITGRLGARSAR